MLEVHAKQRDVTFNCERSTCEALSGNYRNANPFAWNDTALGSNC